VRRKERRKVKKPTPKKPKERKLLAKDVKVDAKDERDAKEEVANAECAKDAKDAKDAVVREEDVNAVPAKVVKVVVASAVVERVAVKVDAKVNVVPRGGNSVQKERRKENANVHKPFLRSMIQSEGW